MNNSANPWWYDQENHQFVLLVPPKNIREHWYHIDRCTTSAEILDHLAQMSGKIWGTDEVLAGFIRKVDEVLHLQSTMCGGGREHGPIDVRKFLKEENLLID